jgi:pilus assembly protein Flp/PilA
MSVKEKVLAFLREEEGLTTVEYGIAGAVVAAGVVATFVLLRNEIIAAITRVINALKN